VDAVECERVSELADCRENTGKVGVPRRSGVKSKLESSFFSDGFRRNSLGDRSRKFRGHSGNRGLAERLEQGRDAE